ncbi:MAG: protease inhibitor I42 family protein [Candidatus Saganbacteria bacterium]|nr:protease inhibitor I42 family protein [Candidatus Saganbacteria bacterium]
MDRKRNIILAVGLLVLVATLLFFGLRVLRQDSAEVISVRQGDEFTLSLGSNATTGYQWQLSQPLDQERLKLISSVYITPEQGRIGQGGVEHWTFKALKSGRAVIKLGYLRPWEKEVPPVKSKAFLIRIEQ